MPDGFDSLFLYQCVRGREAMHLTLNQRERSQPRFESGRTHQFRKRNSMVETSPFKRRDVSSTLTASTTQLSSNGSGRGASNSGMQVRFLLAAPCFQAMTCSTRWPSPLSFKQKITGSSPVHVTTLPPRSVKGRHHVSHT